MKFLLKNCSLKKYEKKSEITTFPKAVDFGYAAEDYFTITRGPLTSSLDISWQDLVKYLALHGIEHWSRKFREVMGGATFVSEGYLVTISAAELPA